MIGQLASLTAQRLAAFNLPATSISVRPKLGHWTDLLSSKAAGKMKETELLGDFIRDVFVYGETSDERMVEWNQDSGTTPTPGCRTSTVMA
jgi:hypothetical protein